VTEEIFIWELIPEVIRIILVIQGEMSRKEIQKELSLADEKHFRENYLKPAITKKYIEMTIPDKPKSSNQKYRLAKSGIELQKELRSQKNRGN
jgi:ATP-dependent DNA helicase RecG